MKTSHRTLEEVVIQTTKGRPSVEELELMDYENEERKDRNNPHHANQWFTWLENGGRPVNQFELLHIMRPLVERILRRYDCKTPPSQSWRAERVLEHINEIIKSRPGGFENFRVTLKYMRDRRTLKDFLAVHRTVWIL